MSFIKTFSMGFYFAITIFHFIVALGRKKKDRFESLTLSFGLFFLFMNLFLHTWNITKYNIYFNLEIRYIYIICNLCSFFAILFFFLFVDSLINYPKNRKNIRIIILIPLFISIVISTITNFISFDLYEYSFRKIVIILLILPCFGAFIDYVYIVIKEKKYKLLSIKILIIAFLSIIVFMVLLNLTYIYKFPNLLTDLLRSYFGFTIVMFFFSFSLTLNLNQDHHDLIDLKNTLEQKVVERTKQLEEANKQKTDFFINLTHEIKTPLTLLGNHINKLSNLIYKNTDKNINNTINIIIESYGKLEKDIVNFLNVEKLAKGKILYNQISTIDFKYFIKKKIELFQENAAINNIKITDILDEAYIDIDPDALDCILNNLLENAIKYNKKNGSIHISLKKEKNKVIFNIKDIGIGMDKKHINHIFEPYYQISHEKSNIQGMGMGLSIVKNIIKHNGGEIKVESIKDKGSMFTIIFPESKNKIIKNEKEIINIKKPSRIVKVELLPENYDENKPTIFLVEDNKKTVSMLQRDLYKIYNVFYAKNGMEALDKIIKIPKPDIIISDIMMDEMDGLSFCQKIKNISRYKDIPFIFLTAKTTEEDKINGYLKGAADYMVKPFSLKELYLKIDKIIEQFRGNKNKIIKEISEDKKEKINKNYLNYKITNKQIQIINMIKEGKQNKEIADKLNITEGTVKNQLSKIFLKTKVKTRTELIKLFL